MSALLGQVTQIYPSLASQISSGDSLSDSKLMAELGSFVVDLFESGQIEDVPLAFELAERLIATGNASERHVAIVGFLETVQNVASHRTFGSRVFEPFLGAASQQAWLELNEIWKNKSSLAQVVASETGATLRRQWWQFWKRSSKRSPSQMLAEVQSPELRKIIEQITRE